MELLGALTFKRLNYLFYFFLSTVAVYVLSTLFIFYIDLKLVDYLPPSTDPVKAPRQKTSDVRSHQFYKGIWARNLFSVKTDEMAIVTPADAARQIGNLSLTSLNCTLVGTIIRSGGRSIAIIKDGDSNRQDKYTVGSTIKGAKVTMIMRNKVVLNLGGKDELLVMGIEKLKAEKAIEKTLTKESSQGDVSTFTITKNFIRESTNNVAQIMANVRIKPHFKDGKPAGFKLSRIKKGSMFQSMGFKDADIIKSVNGHKIQTAGDIMKLYGTLNDANFFSIEVLRGNQIKTLNYRVR